MSRVAIVTGASSGNGLAIATRFLARGDRVAALDLSAETLEETARTHWHAYADKVLRVRADVADEGDVNAAIAATMEQFGAIDVLVNNAGITGNSEAGVLHTTPVEQFDKVMAVNVRGIFLGCRAVLPHMLLQGAGVIVNIASVASLVAFPGRSAYTTSKGAVLQLTKSVAVDYAGSGIRCNAVCPGMIETPMTQWRLDQPELRDQVLARIPQKEIGTAAQVADAVMFLAGEDATYVNGAALVMDGAYTAI
ncbi:short-chain dehydrogenase/reductase SDR (plasmid) [Xanthobacter versatilis]|uniref:2-(R)-hydroxypropyl-CoM dehydrogenase n=1 Tax=Xanthobacter autotrophicus (strain ATCC BAA-1158 / Py2) TaxID=78245 RepID=HCDR1_XANP2|nr:RecName: Full=2-(R)-hydroxypropyl-CoM dehydrogenase; Short=R-HPCDH; AltName: Full=2-[(R)-2-hydroxypropylthio]ethanesulfonate dehydrogenase; AltName: Full=Aliphatic epoxide carboxylation component III; AltName: Full=Epoxide carboxylase component III; AltName: Full=RHPCDH1 [Xanthobacter autotrophicus Py2]2CFC_A Chain A, 2-(R)-HYDROXYPROPYL-COM DEHYDROGENASE [Xanthobacter autotrophicus]2CFC_B Chain B, 2-(R)-HYDROXYPROPYL-COM DEHYDROGENASE [Xanthobacter autotrophicus]2CFC_C Chain C, 2-(R)-HYDROXY